ncbi:carboxypeptidase-like regulatory domain-containing protein [Algoriphagus aestuarii]|nr:carboxypeptidase-like regulatory domain-containing protein [Algoriphagus aestuarii]
MKSSLLSFILFLVLQGAYSQVSYSGNILDANDKRYLEGVLVEVQGKSESDSTNSRGYFNVQAIAGDTLKVTFPGFIDQQIILSSERFIQIQIQDQARLLPTFEVKAEPYTFRFKDGKLILVDPNEVKPESSKGQMTAGYRDSPEGGVAIGGVISYFTKKSKNAREYAKKLEYLKRREGYLKIIDSDSIKNVLGEEYEISEGEWDPLIIKFNQMHAHHEFLDWSSEKVYARLKEFIEWEKDWSN